MTQKSDRNRHSYNLPVARLLAIGSPERGVSWPDYPDTYGLTLEHVPELLRMVQDEELNLADEDSDEVWAPLHAWRALGQLQAEAAVEGLLSVLYMIDDADDDWMMEEMPVVLGEIGPAAIAALAEYIADSANGEFARITAARALSEVGQRHPQARDRCVAVLAKQLAHFRRQDDGYNAFLISNLVDLKAVEAAPIMEEAFAADRVELPVQGDWEDVQISLGLLEQRRTPRARWGGCMNRSLRDDRLLRLRGDRRQILGVRSVATSLAPVVAARNTSVVMDDRLLARGCERWDARALICRRRRTRARGVSPLPVLAYPRTHQLLLTLPAGSSIVRTMSP